MWCYMELKMLKTFYRFKLTFKTIWIEYLICVIKKYWETSSQTPTLMKMIYNCFLSDSQLKKVFKSWFDFFPPCYSQCTCYCTHVFFTLLFFFPFKNIWCWVIDNLSFPPFLFLFSSSKSFNFSIRDKYIIFPMFSCFLSSSAVSTLSHNFRLY